MAYDIQSPNEALTYTVDWTSWLAPGDTLQSATWTIAPATGVTLNDLGEQDGVASVRASALTRGQAYLLTCRMASAAGETGEQSIAILCELH